MSAPHRDMTARSAVKGLASWIGKGSDAIVVMVVQGEDHVFWMHESCRPEDAADLVQGLLGDMVAKTKAEREELRLAKAERSKAKE